MKSLTVDLSHNLNGSESSIVQIVEVNDKTLTIADCTTNTCLLGYSSTKKPFFKFNQNIVFVNGTIFVVKH